MCVCVVSGRLSAHFRRSINLKLSCQCACILDDHVLRMHVRVGCVCVVVCGGDEHLVHFIFKCINLIVSRYISGRCTRVFVLKRERVCVSSENCIRYIVSFAANFLRRYRRKKRRILQARERNELEKHGKSVQLVTVCQVSVCRM